MVAQQHARGCELLQVTPQLSKVTVCAALFNIRELSNGPEKPTVRPRIGYHKGKAVQKSKPQLLLLDKRLYNEHRLRDLCRVQGDSIFMHVRNGEVLHRAKAGLHFFDCPFQFGNAPEHTTGTDTAEDADMASFDVQPNDILVVATDGIWDNMQDADILGLLPSSASGLDKVTHSIHDTLILLFQLRLELVRGHIVMSAHHD